MCGIYGFIGKPRNKAKTVKLMNRLMINTEERGRHSAGFFAVTPEEYVLEKLDTTPERFWQVCCLPETIKRDKAYLVMGHNRWASIGEVSHRNAHPFETNLHALTHNGTCPSALLMLKSKFKGESPLEGTTDSEAILHLIDANGGVLKSEKLFSKLENFSLTVFEKKTETLFFARNESPCYIVDLRKQLGIRVWSSTIEIMANSLKEAGFDIGSVYGFSTKPGVIYSATMPDLEINTVGKFSLNYFKPTRSISHERKSIKWDYETHNWVAGEADFWRDIDGNTYDQTH